MVILRSILTIIKPNLHNLGMGIHLRGVKDVSISYLDDLVQFWTILSPWNQTRSQLLLIIGLIIVKIDLKMTIFFLYKRGFYRQ